MKREERDTDNRLVMVVNLSIAAVFLIIIVINFYAWHTANRDPGVHPAITPPEVYNRELHANRLNGGIR